MNNIITTSKKRERNRRHIERRFRRFCALLIVIVAAIEVLVVLGSWIITAVWPDIAMRSLFSADGLRWLFGQSTKALATDVLVWLIMMCVASGAVAYSRLCSVFVKHPLSYRQWVALRFVFVEVLAYVVMISLLTLVPHAALLSVTGLLFPSSFSTSVVPQLAILATICSLTYGWVCGTVRGLDGMLTMLSKGIEHLAPLFVLYILVAELYFTLLFIRF